MYLNLNNQYLIGNNCANNVKTDTAYNNNASPYCNIFIYSGKMHVGFLFLQLHQLYQIEYCDYLFYFFIYFWLIWMLPHCYPHCTDPIAFIREYCVTITRATDKYIYIYFYLFFGVSLCLDNVL